MRSTLAPYAAAMRDADPQEVRRIAEKAWHETGLVILKREWLKGPVSQWWNIEAVATAVHGKRRPKAGE